MSVPSFLQLRRGAREAGILLDRTGRHLGKDRVYQMAASLSFFTLFSLSPLVLIAASVAGTILGRENARQALLQRVEEWTGGDVAGVINSLITRISGRFDAFWPGLIGVSLVILGALVVFINLKIALNRIWGIEIRPGHPWRTLLRNRLVSFVMVLASGFLLLVSVLFGSLLKALGQWIAGNLPAMLPLLKWLNGLAALIVVVAVFSLIYRYLPDARINWRPVLISAALTAALFFGGRELISRYLGITFKVSVFGAASSLVALMLWIYYSALIFLAGAELSQVLHRRYWPEDLQPAAYAMTVPKPADLVQKAGAE